MIRFSVSQLFCTLFIVLVTSLAFAQDSLRPVADDSVSATLIDTVRSLPGVEVRTAVDPPTAFIGDPINYTVTIIYDSAYELIPPPLGANLGAFDVRDYNADYDSVLSDGRLLNETKFVLSTFTTGDYVIPPVPIRVKRKDGTESIFLSEPVPITIQSLLANTSDSIDIRPLKPLAVVESNEWIWWVAGGSLLALLIVGYLLLRRKKLLARAVDIRTAWEEAFASLAQLEQLSLIADGKYREYYGQLTDIIRIYLGRLHHSTLPDMTTDEIVSWLQLYPRLEKWRDDLTVFLRAADLYKFARVEPTADRPVSDFSFVHGMIGELRDEYLAGLEAQRAAQREAERVEREQKGKDSQPPSGDTETATSSVHSNEAAEHSQPSDVVKYSGGQLSDERVSKSEPPASIDLRG